MFVEVKVLCDGEMPNGVGYLFLGPEEIQQLFYNENTYRLNIEKKSIGVIIPKKVLTTITNDSISHAVKCLEQRTLSEIKELRLSKESSMDLEHTRASAKPRHYAFLLQQYINAMLFNERRGESNQDIPLFFENISKENEKLEKKIKHLESIVTELKTDNKTLELKNKRLKLELICNKLKFENMGDDPKISESIFHLSRAVDYFCKRGHISKTLCRALTQSFRNLNTNKENQELLRYFREASNLLGIEWASN